MMVEHRFAHIPQDGRRGRAWIASQPPLAEVRLAPDATVPPGVFHSYHHLGEAVLAAFDAPAHTSERTESLAAAQGIDHLALHVRASGRIRIAVGTAVVEAAPGDLVLLDLARSATIEAPASAGVALIVPIRLMSGQARAALSHGCILEADVFPVAPLLGSHLLQLAACLKGVTPTQGRLLVGATLDLCRALVAIGGDRAAFVTENAMTMRRYIDENIDRVDIPMLMARFGLSRRSLYRRFPEQGGIHAYIRDRRLAAAMRRLVRAGGGRPEKLAAVAHSSGFENPRVFSRAFRRKYGVWPREAKATPVPPGDLVEEKPPMSWLRNL